MVILINVNYYNTKLIALYFKILTQYFKKIT